MIILCPECEMRISDKAYACPHCGYPLMPGKAAPVKQKSRMRLPNGFGQISEIKGRNLRNRFRVMISDGKTAEGKPIQKMLKPQAYFPTYKDAYEALIEYHKNPYELEKDLTVKELYNLWISDFIKHAKTQKAIDQHTNVWPYCSSIYGLKLKTMRAYHIKECIEHASKIKNGEEIEASPTTKMKMKYMFNLMLDYATERELVDKNYARLFSLPSEITDKINEEREHHIAFSDEEMRLLWENINAPGVDLMLVNCYMGWRPQELCGLKISNTHFDEHYIIGGLKTKAGKSRIVPIHPRIENIIKKYYDKAIEIGSDNLFNYQDLRYNNRWVALKYPKYAAYFSNIIETLKLNPDHKPHDCRKQFVTSAKKYKVDEYAIKRIAGHSIDDITETIYTERSVDWLYSEICKIK